MPLYEYVCDKCKEKFEALRPVSRMDDPAVCSRGHTEGRRVLSTFACHTGEGGGEVEPMATGGCGGGCSNCSCGG